MTETTRIPMILTAVAAALTMAACDTRDNRTAATGTTTAPTRSATTGASDDAKRSAEEATAAANRAAERTGQAADDSAITAKVKAALLAEPGLDSLDIHVDTKEGAVTLSGNVDTSDKKTRAKDVAARVSGVRNVVDNLAVKRG